MELWRSWDQDLPGFSKIILPPLEFTVLLVDALPDSGTIPPAVGGPDSTLVNGL